MRLMIVMKMGTKWKIRVNKIPCFNDFIDLCSLYRTYEAKKWIFFLLGSHKYLKIFYLRLIFVKLAYYHS